MKKKHREYNNDYPSVTEVLSVLRKPALEAWYMNNTREFCYERMRVGKEIGTQTHEAIQSFIETGKAKIETTHHMEVSNALKSFMKFSKENKIKLIKSEMLLTSDTYGFNGTIDCLSDGLIVDWKTCEKKDKDKPPIYDEWKYQVAAYVYLYNELHSINVDKAMIVSIAKDDIAYSTCVMEWDEIQDCFENVFLPCLTIKNYQRKGKKDAVLI